MLPQLTVEGRIGSDPELRFTAQGMAICTFSLVCSDRKKVGDKWEDSNTSWFRVTTFKQSAENVAESLQKGDLVIVQGKVGQNDYTNKDGEAKTSYQQITANMIGPSLAFTTATVNRAKRGEAGAAAPAVDPWATPAGDTSAPPF